MKKIAVFGEIYSQNLGDGVIFDCLNHLFMTHGVKALPVDLSGRTSWHEEVYVTDGTGQAGLLRKIGRIVLRRSRVLRRFYSAFSWYWSGRNRVYSNWEHIVASSDAVVIGGGQLLTDVNFGFTPRIYLVAKIAKKYGKPLAIFGCGVGSGWGYVSKYMYKRVLAMACYVSVRDHQSAALLSSYKLNCEKIEVHPDPAFIAAQTSSGVPPVESDTIGVNILPVTHVRAFVPVLKNLSDEAYLDFWYRLIRGACEAGERVVVLTNGDPADYAEAEKVVTRLAEEGFKVNLEDRPSRPQELLTQLRKVSRLICTRMHAGIVAYSLGRKVVPISWDQKVDGVWDAIGLKQVVVPASVMLEIDPWQTFQERFQSTETFSSNLHDIGQQIVAAAGRCVDSLGFER